MKPLDFYIYARESYLQSAFWAAAHAVFVTARNWDQMGVFDPSLTFILMFAFLYAGCLLFYPVVVLTLKLFRVA